MNEAQTRLNKIDPKLRDAGWGIDRLKANYEKIAQECDALKQAFLRQVFE